jgi:hypothetical protein
MQDLPGTTTLCEMNIIPVAEMVLQLQDNWYLVHSPQPMTSRIDCLNSSVSEAFIRSGANRVHVSPSCRLHLTSHMLISNFAVQLDTVIKHYEWELGQISFSAEEQAHSDEWHAAFEETSIRAKLTQICHSLAIEKCSSIWSFIFSLIRIVIFVTVAVLISYAFFTPYYFTLSQRVIRWVMHILPKSVCALMPSPPPQGAEA